MHDSLRASATGQQLYTDRTVGEPFLTVVNNTERNGISPGGRAGQNQNNTYTLNDIGLEGTNLRPDTLHLVKRELLTDDMGGTRVKSLCPTDNNVLGGSTGYAQKAPYAVGLGVF